MYKPGTKLLSERVYEQLEDAIVRRELPPGSHLVEDEVAGRLGVSRTPVREAFRILARERWLDLHPHAGAYVRHPTLDEVRDLFEVRATLDRRATELAVVRITPRALRELDKIVERGSRAVLNADGDRIVTLNVAFHGAIAEAAGNQYLIRMLREIEKQVRWHFSAVAVRRRVDSWHEHEEIVEAIKSQDAERAGQLIEVHNERTLDAYVSSLLGGRTLTDDGDGRLGTRLIY